MNREIAKVLDTLRTELDIPEKRIAEIGRYLLEKEKAREAKAKAARKKGGKR
jgi:hypothetical protein